MANCLVTKLKESVQNNRLPKLDSLRIVSIAPVSFSDDVENRLFTWQESNNTKIAVIEGSMKFSADGQVYTDNYDSSSPLTYVTGSGIFDIQSKSLIRSIYFGSFFKTENNIFKELSYMPLLLDFSIVAHTFEGLQTTIDDSISDLIGVNSNLASIVIEGCPNITGNIENIIRFAPNLVSLKLINTQIQGSLSQFISNGALVLPNLATLTVQICPNFTTSQEDVDTLMNLGVTVTI